MNKLIAGSGMVVGIDPGASGGIAHIHANGDYMAFSMPATEHDLWANIEILAERGVALAVVEVVAARPGAGVSGMFKFGQNYGALRMAVVAAGIRLELVTPSVWQGKLNCRTKGDKNITKALAQRLFPRLKVTHATADALLLAEYGRRFLLPQPAQAVTPRGPYSGDLMDALMRREAKASVALDKGRIQTVSEASEREEA